MGKMINELKEKRFKDLMHYTCMDRHKKTTRQKTFCINNKNKYLLQSL